MISLSQEQVRYIAIEALRLRGLTYDEKEGLAVRLVEPTGPTVPHWIVSYISQSSMFEPRDFFMHIQDGTGEILYILGPHGKLRETMK